MTRAPDGLQISEVNEIDASPPRPVDRTSDVLPSRDRIAEIEELIRKAKQLRRQSGDVEAKLIKLTELQRAKMAAPKSTFLLPRVLSAFRSSAFGAGFVSRLGDMITIIGPRGDPRPFPGTGRTVAEALRSDWEKLGGDMRRAVNKVIPVDGR